MEKKLVKEIASMRREGMRDEDIAEYLGVSKSAISYNCPKKGAKKMQCFKKKRSKGTCLDRDEPCGCCG